MIKYRFLLSAFAALLLITGVTQAATISASISGPGAANDSTIVAGQPVSIDIYFDNDAIQVGFTVGFKLTSKDIKGIVHSADSGNGVNDGGDIKGHNGFQDKSIWDLAGLFVVEQDWDGALPDLIGFGGVCVKKEYKPHEAAKCLSFDLVAPETGVLTLDSAFFAPSGKWLFARADKAGIEPIWEGPYHFKVVKEAPAKPKEE